MKYLYHHRTLGMNVEGVHIRSICCALEKKGHQVRLVSVDSANDNYKQVKVAKENKNKKTSILKIISKRFPEPIFELLEMAYSLYSFFRLWRIIHDFRPDRIYERYSMFLFSTIFLSKIYKIPVVYEINDSAALERLRPLYFTKLAKFIEQRVFLSAHGLVFVSSRLKEIIEGEYSPVNCIISPNAIDPDIFFFDQKLKTIAKDKLNLNNKVICGFVGCFARWHGVHIFMEALAPQLKNHPDLIFLFLGEGETLAKVKSIINEHNIEKQVILTGNIPHDQVINYLRAMDFSVLPSSNEYGSPMKQFELMGTGVPLVAPDYPPITEIIEDDLDGWIFRKGDFEHCIQRLLEIYKNQDDLEKKGQAACQKIHEKHLWRHNIDQLDLLFETTKNN